MVITRSRINRAMTWSFIAGIAALAFPVVAAAQLQCYDCHGTRASMDNRPLDASSRDISTGGFPGNHRTHLPVNAAKESCATCHPGSEQRTNSNHDGKIKVSAKINKSQNITTYKNQTSAFQQNPVPSPDRTDWKCTNVNCHFEKITPAWGSASFDRVSSDNCNACHGFPPIDGRHPSDGSGQKHLAYYGTATSCKKCHPDHLASSAHFSHATSAGKRGLAVHFTSYSNNVGSYKDSALSYPEYLNKNDSERNGSCSNLYCHSDGRGGAPKVTPVWRGENLPGDCTGCHGGDSSSAHAIASGNHGLHIGTLTCGRCHSATVGIGDNRTISNRALHLDGSKNVVFFDGGSYDRIGKTCSDTSTQCHPSSVTEWEGTGCTSCHRSDSASLKPMATGKHLAHLNNYSTLGINNGLACVSCHANTVIDNQTIGNPANHKNGLKNYSGLRAGRITVATPDLGKCNTVYCHSTGTKEKQFWNMTAANWYSSRTLGCNGCHGTRNLPDGSLAPNNSVAGEPNYQNGGVGTSTANDHQTHVAGRGITDTTGCASCHVATVDSSIPGKQRNYSTLHVNGSRDVTFSAAASGKGVQGRYSSNTQQCMNTYCHGTSPSARWGASSLACTSCHSAENNGFNAYTASSSHSSHYEATTAPVAGSYATMAATNSSSANKYQFNCTSCHSTPATHANGVADQASGAAAQIYFGFTTAGMKGSYSYASAVDARKDNGFAWTRGQCSNTYCHSNGAPFDKASQAKTVTWGGSLPSDCTGCHDRAGASTGLSGRHDKHTDPTGYGYRCERCHKNTVGGSDTVITNKGKHINKIKDVAFKDGGNYGSDKGCTATYCHSDGLGGPPNLSAKWSDSGASRCYRCHKGTALESTEANCSSIQGIWSSSKNSCTPDLTMSTYGHHRLVGPQWIRKYPCTYCHNDTVKAIVDGNGKITGDGDIRFTNNSSRHVNGRIDVLVAPQWDVVGMSAASFDKSTKACTNIYCHSDGTSIPENIRVVGWSEKTDCNSCHGHPRGTCNNVGCHDGRTDSNGKTWPVLTGWAPGSEWVGAMPMFPNQGEGLPRANSHPRHNETNLTCDNCHAKTVVNGTCKTCHISGIPAGSMSEVAHVNPQFHVNKSKDVDFKDGGSYDKEYKKCSNTSCHVGIDPVWGGSVNSVVICVSCHQANTATGGDVDSFGFITTDTRAKINMDEWAFSGHGRYSTSGRYPVSGNPAANFPKSTPTTNPCWYCHDNNVLHNDQTNPFRLRQHSQFSKRFEKECVYCHMQGLDSECLGCHKSTESLSPQLTSSAVIASHSGATYLSGCRNTGCHDSDATLHNTGSTQFWAADKKDDVKKQYIMMGVCLKCHDDDSADQCNGCHDYSLPKYQLGFNPGTGFIKPKKARASSSHFGYKHYNDYLADGKWRGGKFCWDCHDPHGDKNIYMVHDKVATTTDGKFGIPLTRADVVFTKKQSGTDYANSDPLKPYNGICNVCHTSSSRHYQSDKGDGHNAGRICTDCHEHRFADSHADGKLCNSCHSNSKPVPKHASFGLPQDCTKCHSGVVNKRMDVMGQFNANSHHIQGVKVTNKQCYTCHWESTPDGFIDRTYHEGYDYKNYTGVPNTKVDLVVWKAGKRPIYYNSSTAVQFLASNIGKAGERAESAKVSNHCLGCHSDQNNDTDPFGDCKTPRIYAWDFLSIGARYSQIGTTPWGKVSSDTYPNANQKDRITKAFSAHGNVANNQGGYSTVDGIDKNIPDSTGVQNVQCYDCHNSHGSKVTGVTSSYVTFNGTKNGANLKETQAGKGGYSVNYKASSNSATGAVNPYNAGAGQCFDCHNSQSNVTTPWGYQSTFGATAPISGYYDTPRFGAYSNSANKFAYKRGKQAVGGHMKAETFLNRTTSAKNKINGLCTPCHDPHGVSPSLGANQAYSVPLLKGTWMTSPYKEDVAQDNRDNLGPSPDPAAKLPYVYTDQKSFNGDRVSQSDSTFAGLCTRCHNKSSLTSDACSNTAFNNNSTQCKTNGAVWSTNVWKSKNRVHEAVSGWKTSNNNLNHSYTCSKCHTPHVSTMPRLMITNCLDWKHRGRLALNGQLPSGSGSGLLPGGDGGPRSGGGEMPKCHPGALPAGSFDNSWNSVTPWPGVTP